MDLFVLLKVEVHFEERDGVGFCFDWFGIWWRGSSVSENSLNRLEFRGMSFRIEFDDSDGSLKSFEKPY